MAYRLLEKTATVTLVDGAGRIAVVSDTHSAPHKAIGERLAALRPDAILHAGDIGELGVLEDLATIAPLHAVRGNIDGRANDVPDVLTIDVAGRFRIFLVHIAVYGPKLRADIAKKARIAKASLVVCGHSHVPFIGEDRGLTMFNPGSIGPRRFHLPIVFGTIDITPTSIRLAHIDCETGAPWSPP
ncbi:MAG: metallophosphoesterase family protein [Deltaproteobacteria bacterium]|nr:metallophosphoesterase family protein [Deltaproteobacteria bacterium]